MADDPRVEPLARALFEQTRPAWSWDRPPTGGHEVQRAYWRDQAATLLHARLDTKDPLRALLADEGRAVEVGAKARYLASTVSAEPDWDRQTVRAKDAYRDQVRLAIAAVLAALREVAGL